MFLFHLVNSLYAMRYDKYVSCLVIMRLVTLSVLVFYLSSRFNRGNRSSLFT